MIDIIIAGGIGAITALFVGVIVLVLALRIVAKDNDDE